MTTSVVVTGVTGAGKTTVGRALADRLGAAFVEGDDLHPAANVARMRAGTPLTDADRWPWLDAVAEVVGVHEAGGQDLVVTCSALRRAYRDRLRDGHPSVRFLHVTAPEGVLRDRLARRTGHWMPASLLDSQLALLEPLGQDEPGAAVSSEAPLDRLLAAVRSWGGTTRHVRSGGRPAAPRGR